MQDFSNLYMARGVPYNVVHQRVDEQYLDYLVTAEKKIEDKPPVLVTPNKQKSILKKTLADPVSSLYTYFIAGKTDDRLAKVAAFELFCAAFSKSGTSTSPYWHTVYGSYKDQLRDDDQFKQYTLGNPSLLVFSNIANNNTNLKLEKVRDLYEMFPAAPKVFIVLGDDPFEFSARYLHIPFTRCLYFE